MRSIRSCRITVITLLGLAGFANADPQPTAEEGWIAVQSLMFSEALSLFQSELIANTPSARLGQAVAQLHKQPTTRSHIEEALSILESLSREAPGSPEALQAAYLKARVIQLNPFEPDPDRALTLYRQLVAESPDSLFGQLSFLKWAGLQLYSPALADSEVPFATIEDEGAFVSDPDCRRSLHLLLAEAGQRRRHDDTFVLRHYLLAYEAGLTKPDLRANVLARIIVLARETGELDLARSHAATFIASFPRDIRITQIKELLAEMEVPEE